MAREAPEELDGFLSLLADHGELKHGPETFLPRGGSGKKGLAGLRPATGQDRVSIGAVILVWRED